MYYAPYLSLAQANAALLADYLNKATQNTAQTSRHVTKLWRSAPSNFDFLWLMIFLYQAVTIVEQFMMQNVMAYDHMIWSELVIQTDVDLIIGIR